MKKYFVVTRSITEIEGKPHVETISEAELVRCENCFFATQGSTEVGEWYMRCRLFDIAVDTDFFCANGKRK